MPAERPKLSISTRGVLYVLIPAIVQLSCLFGLLLLLNEEDKVGERDSHSEEVISRTNWMCVLVSSAVAGRIGYLETGSAAAQNLGHGALEQFSSNVAALQLLVKDEPGISLVLQQAQPYLKRLEDVLQGSNSPAHEQIAQIVQVSEQTWPQLMVARRYIVRPDKALSSTVPKTPPRYRQAAKYVISILILFTAASALIVIYRFGRTIARRLAITSDNTVRLSQGASLNQPVDGDDEIAQLDQAFHHMASELARAQRRKQEYISMISHDIRTPLTSVYGSIEYLESGYGGELNDRGSGMTERALRNLERVLQMINSLLLIEQLESGMTNFVLVDNDLDSIVDKAIESIQDLASRHQISVESKVDDTRVVADEQRTVQIIVNLLGNALKFSPENSSIEISSREKDEMVELRVTDHGRGIPPAALDQIFTRFQQVQPSDAEAGSGVGLGLAICKAIVQGQGGTIGVESEPGVGSTFWFTLKKSHAGDE
ncbi:MAG TPA: HAMP domain-containing sensor histidine kinase [Planktothrix sp.]|jgi:signal transduction histidine kinase